MKTIEFSYKEPRLGEIDIEQELSEDEAVALVEQTFPEAEDVEIINMYEVD